MTLPNVTNVQTVVAVRIALLVESGDAVGQNTTLTYRLLNAPTLGPFTDNRLRQVYQRTIVLRNHT